MTHRLDSASVPLEGQDRDAKKVDVNLREPEHLINRHSCVFIMQSVFPFLSLSHLSTVIFLFQTVVETILAPTAHWCASVPMGPTAMG